MRFAKKQFFVLIMFVLGPACYGFLTDDIWGGIKSIGSGVGDFVSSVARIGVDGHVQIQGLQEACKSLERVANQLSQAAENASGNLKQGMQDLAASLQEIAKMPAEIDKILGNRLPEIEQRLKSSIQQIEKSASNIVAETSQKLQENIRLTSQEAQKIVQQASQEAQINIKLASQEVKEILKRAQDLSREITNQLQFIIEHADAKLKERIQQMDVMIEGRLVQMDVMIKGRLQDIQKIIDDIDSKLNQLVDKIDQKANALVDKINQDVNQWLDKASHISDDTIRKFFQEFHRMQQEAVQTIGLVEDMSNRSIDRFDKVMEQRLRQVQVLMEKGTRRFQSVGSVLGTATTVPLILGITPGPVFSDFDAQQTIRIAMMNFPDDEGDWAVRVVPPETSQESPRIPRIAGTNPGMEELLISGDFINELTPDITYVLEVQKSYTKEATLISQETNVLKVARCLISKQSKILDLQLELQISDVDGNTIYPPSGFDKIPIKELSETRPWFILEGPHLPAIPKQISLLGSLRIGQLSIPLKEGTSSLQLSANHYTVTIRILKEPGYKVFKQLEWVARQDSERLLKKFLEGQSSENKEKAAENALNYLSFRSSLHESQGNSIRYLDHSINPVYVVYLQVTETP